jgi:hypothetical protein
MAIPSHLKQIVLLEAKEDANIVWPTPKSIFDPMAKH